MRVLLYARFSSDLQNAASADDQLAALRRSLAQRAWTEVGAFQDAGISGAALPTRPGVQALMRRAAAGDVDVVMTEALDRLSRSQADIARLYELLSFYGVRLETLGSGQVSELHVGLEGTMNRLFLVELGKKTRRGLIARVEAGFSGGGRCYGYRVRADAKGVLEVDEAEASIVRRIFTEYLAGVSPRSIARTLNAERVAGARGGLWTAASINGDRRAGDGILHQELYVGVRVFNRRHFRKHPETGRRSGVLNPPAEWIRKPAPELRILDDATWSAAQHMNAELGAAGPLAARRPRRLLSGLVQCSRCGGPMILVGPGTKADAGDRPMACSRHRSAGDCDNRVHVRASELEGRILAVLRQHLLRPEMVAEVTRLYHDAHHAEHQAARARLAGAQRELEEIQRRRTRAWEAYDDGHLAAAAFGKRIAELEAREAELQAEISALGEIGPPVALHPNTPGLYRQLVEQLHTAIARDDAQEVREALRPLIHHVTVHPLPDSKPRYALTLTAKAKALLGEPGRADERTVPLMGAGTRSGQEDGPLIEIAA